MARYSHGDGARSVDVASKVGQIMLRYRPIAPKPVPPGASPPPSNKDSSQNTGSSRRGRRRCGGGGVDGKESRRGRKKRDEKSAVVGMGAGTTSSSGEEENGFKEKGFSPPAPITLSLISEIPERKEENRPGVETPSPPSDMVVVSYPRPEWYGSCQVDGVVAPPSGSVVIVECVAEAGEIDDVWRWLCWCREAEARRLMEGDAWPAFVSDVSGWVTGTNPAYRRMVGSEVVEDGGGGGGGGVRLEMAKTAVVPPGRKAALTCRVRVKYFSRRGKGSLTAPCDVWRLADGGLAWRLDIDAALSLRR